MKSLKNLSKQELLEIYDSLNSFKWDERLGKKPCGFDEMPYRDKSSSFCRYKTIKPYINEIKKLTSEKDRFKYHHLVNLDRSLLQFEWWWIKRSLRIKLTGSPF